MSEINSQLPKIGERIYVPSSSSHDYYEKDIVGGLATISAISYAYSVPFIDVEELPKCSFSYRFLLEKQKQLHAKFKDQTAHFSTLSRPLHLANESLAEAHRHLQDFKDQLSGLNDVFNLGDQASVKVIGLALQRLQKKMQQKLST